MAGLRRVVAVYMLLVAVAVPVHLLVTRFYDSSLDETANAVWRILDPLMVVGLVVVLIVAYARKRQVDAGPAGQPVHREYLEANVTLYFSAALFLMLLWNWFGFQWGAPDSDMPLLWIVIDTTVPLLLAATAHRLWHKTS